MYQSRIPVSTKAATFAGPAAWKLLVRLDFVGQKNEGAAF
jgi:hypothetical protein